MSENSIKNQESVEEDFRQRLDEEPSVEDKIKFTLEEMKKTLSVEGKINFKFFWEMKNQCLLLFKKPMNSFVRSKFWKEYIDISEEFKKIKNILNEQTDFEVEQIDLAISSIEMDLEKYDEVLLSIKEIEIDKEIKVLTNKISFYLQTQKELTFLNAFATRINSLRKEIIKTNMRISFKNKFLKRLAFIGDNIFPKRKELIEEISKEFNSSIDEFVSEFFDLQKVAFFKLKDEIKSLQNIAKKFTLNTKTFMDCRLKLSKCWDEIKLAEKEYKKERQKAKTNIDQVLVKIKKLNDLCQEALDEKSIENEEKEIINFIQTLDLKKEDVGFLRYKIKEAKNPIYERQQQKKEKKVKQANDKESDRKRKLEDIKNKVSTLLEEQQLSVEELEQEKNQIDKDLKDIEVTKFEKLTIEKELNELNHLIEDKKDNLNISNDIKDILIVFEQKKKKRKNIKKNLDNLNKELASSNFDFEKAMIYRDLIDSEKLRLEMIEDSINVLEEKIQELESN